MIRFIFLGAFLSAEPAEIKGCVNIWCLCHKRLPLAWIFLQLLFRFCAFCSLTTWQGAQGGCAGTALWGAERPGTRTMEKVLGNTLEWPWLGRMTSNVLFPAPIIPCPSLGWVCPALSEVPEQFTVPQEKRCRINWSGIPDLPAGLWGRHWINSHSWFSCWTFGCPAGTGTPGRWQEGSAQATLCSGFWPEPN